MPRSVCLLRSRRRTVLFWFNFPWLFHDWQKSPWLSDKILKFPDFSLTGKTSLIFPVFPGIVGTLRSCKLCQFACSPWIGSVLLSIHIVHMHTSPHLSLANCIPLYGSWLYLTNEWEEFWVGYWVIFLCTPCGYQHIQCPPPPPPHTQYSKWFLSS